MRVALKFAYDGKNFYGFARQPNLKTVEGEIIKLLVKNGYIKNLTKSVFRYASRTDKKVSSFGNVIAFNTEKNVENIFEELNKKQKEVLFYGYKIVETDFYPRYAKQRIYIYYLKNDGKNLEEIKSFFNIFIGEHNFSNFARIEPGKNPFRKIDDIKIKKTNCYFLVEIYAQTFLYNQIRRIISAFEKYSNGKFTMMEIENALKNPEIKTDFGLAFAEPLILKDVVYDFEFETCKKSIKKLEKFSNSILFSIENLDG